MIVMMPSSRGPECGGPCHSCKCKCHGPVWTLALVMLFVITQGFSFFVGVIDHTQSDFDRWPKRWHYVFPGHVVGQWVGEFMSAEPPKNNRR